MSENESPSPPKAAESPATGHGSVGALDETTRSLTDMSLTDCATKSLTDMSLTDCAATDDSLTDLDDSSADGAAASASRSEEARIETFRRRWTGADDLPGDEYCRDIRREYVCEGLLGSGKSGRTFFVRRKETGEKAAMKLCSLRRLARAQKSMPGFASSDGKLDDPKFVKEYMRDRAQRMRLEMLIVRCLTGVSPFVAGMVGSGVVCDLNKGELGFMMPLVHASIGHIFMDWVSLADLKNEQTMANYRDMMTFVSAQMAEAVRFLHKCGVVHKDITTGNVLMGSNCYIKLTDFGKSFVETVGPNTCVPPQSIEDVQERLAERPRRRGPPEEVWFCQFLREPEKGRVELGRAVDLHMLGYTLMIMDWPIDFSRPYYVEVEYDLTKPTFEEFFPTYRLTLEMKSISADLADFLRQLTQSNPLERLGYSNPDDLIKHKAFRGIDFAALREQTLRAPMDKTLADYFAHGIILQDTKTISTPWQEESPEEVFARSLSQTEKRFVWQVYLHRPWLV